MTLKEIAQEAQVSISTVSRVINQKKPNAASPEVAERIWEIVRRNGYVPNRTAQDLKKGVQAENNIVEPKTIAIIYARTDSMSTDFFFSHIAKAIEQELFKSNYYLKYSFTSLDFSNPATAAQIAALDVDGIVVLGRYDKKLFHFLTEQHTTVMYAGLNPGDTKFDQVICCGGDIAKAAVNYLYDLGHTKIGYIGAQDNEIRYKGYKRALEKLDLPFRQRNTVNVRQTPDGGYKAANMLMDVGADITAVFCANDNTAIGAMRAFKERGVRIPEDISIIGVDDIETDQYLTPMLTSIHIPLDELGKCAARILIDRLKGGHKLPIKTILPFYIAKRDSCAKPAPGRRPFKANAPM